MTKLPLSLQGPIWTRNQLMNIYGGLIRNIQYLGKTLHQICPEGFKNVKRIQLQKKVHK